MPKFIGFLVGLFIVVVTLIVLFNWDATDYDEYGLEYSAGPIDGKNFERLIAPGSSLKFLGVMDYMVKLPANQRTYIVGTGDGDNAEPIVVTDSQAVELQFQTSSTFELNNNADKLDEFFRTICTKYDDCYDKDGTTADGWGMMLNDYYRKAQESALREVARQYTTDELMKGNLVEFQQKVADATQDKVTNSMGGKYFTDVTFQIQKPAAPTVVQDRYNDAKAAELQTKVNEEQVAQAQQKVEAAKKYNEILEQNPQYIELLKAQALADGIENGSVNIQGWLIPTDSGTNINVK